MFREKRLSTSKLNNSSVISLVGAVLLPAIVMLLVFSKEQIYPFGDKLLVYNDMQYQYTDFFMWLYDVLHGKDSVEYSFRLGMGSNMVSTFAYYLASPLNLLVYFAKKECVGEFLGFLICLKLILCSVTASIYVRSRFALNNLGILIGASYALMGYNLLQCSNVMWLDAVFAAPLLALGLYKLIYEKKHLLYYLTLFYGIITNWYMGYILCLFSVLYFIFEAVMYECQRKPDWKNRLKTFLDFAVTSVLSVLTSAVLFIPQTIYMFTMQEYQSDENIFDIVFSFSFLEGFRDFILEGDKLTFEEYIPPIHIGAVVLILVISLLLSKQVAQYKRNLCYVYFFGFMLMFAFRPINYIFSGFRVPNSHTYRYGFIYGVFLIAIAGMAVSELENIGKQNIEKAMLVILAMACLFDMVQPYSDRSMVYLSCVLVLAVGALLIFLNYYRLRRVLVLVLSALLILCYVKEFSSKLTMVLSDYSQSDEYYTTYNSVMQESADELAESGDLNFRVDKNLSRAGIKGANEGLTFGYKSLSHYVSTNNKQLASFMKKVGYTGQYLVVPYTPILAMDTILGVKYIYSEEKLAGFEVVEKDLLDGIALYENTYSTAIGYAVQDDEYKEYGSNAIENQQILFENLFGISEELYTEGKVSNIKTDGSSWTEWTLTPAEDGAFYFYCNGIGDTTLSVNGKFVRNYAWYDNPVAYIGDFKKNETVKVRITCNGNSYKEDYNMFVATLNEDTLEEVTEQIQENKCTVTRMEKKSLTAEYNGSAGDLVMLTIPYEKGWQVLVNGEEVSYKAVDDTFIGIRMTDDENVIEMTFETPGKKIGIVLSVLGVAVFVIWTCYRKKIKKA